MISPVKKLSHVSEDGIHQLVDASYIKLRIDPELASVSTRFVLDDWQPDLTTMYAVWPSLMLMTGRDKGKPVAKHRVIEGTQKQLLERWLAPFEEAFHELFDGRQSEVSSQDCAHCPESEARIVLSARSAMAI